MVRKWSYLIKVDNSRIKQGLFKKKQNLKIFKITTKFKKFNINFTKILRKTYVKRKRKTIFLNIFYLIYKWFIFFLKIKIFIKFYQILGFFNKHLLLNNIYFFQKNFSQSNISYNSFFYYKYLNSNYKFSNLTKNYGIMVYNNEIFTKLINLYKGLLYLDKNYFLLNNNIKPNFNISNFTLNNILKYNIILYKIFIILSLKHL